MDKVKSVKIGLKHPRDVSPAHCQLKRIEVIMIALHIGPTTVKFFLRPARVDNLCSNSQPTNFSCAKGPESESERTVPGCQPHSYLKLRSAAQSARTDREIHRLSMINSDTVSAGNHIYTCK